MSADMPWGLLLGALAIAALVALVGWEIGRRMVRRRRINRWVRERRDD